MAKRASRELLVVDGYNVILSIPRYQHLIDEIPTRGRSHDPFDRARAALVSDVAAFAQGHYDPVIVFDAGHNLNVDHPELISGGVRLIFSPTGMSADTVIERLVSEQRRNMHEVTVVTSDNTIKSTVGGLPVTSLSSSLLVHEIGLLDHDREQDMADRRQTHLTVEDRLDPATRAKLNKLLGRSS